MSDNTEESPLAHYRLYDYKPSEAAPIVFVVLFAITASYHTFQLFKHKTWYMIAFLLGGFCKSSISR